MAEKTVMIPVGYQQLAVSTTPVGFTLPTPAPNYALISVETAGVRWRDDGTDPTATVGMPLGAGASVEYDGSKLGQFKTIRSSGVDAVLNISYYIRG